MSVLPTREGFWFRSRLIRALLVRHRWSIGIGALVLLVVDGLDVVLPLVLRRGIDAVTALDRPTLRSCALIYILIALCQSVGRYLWRTILFRLSARSARELREQISRRVIEQSLPRIEARNAGEFSSLYTSDVEAVKALFDMGMVVLFDAFFYLATIPATMILLAPDLAAITLPLLLCIPVIVILSEGGLRKTAGAYLESLGLLSGRAQESLAGFRLIRSFSREAGALAHFERDGAAVQEAATALARREAFMAPQLELVISVAMTILIAVGGRWVMGAALTVGTFVAFQRYLQQLLWPTQAVGVWFSQVQRALSAAARISAVLDEPAEPSNCGVRSLPLSAGRSDAAPALSFQAVSLGGHGGHPLIEQVSFEVARGEKVALLGPSGCGKTRLLRCVVGFEQPQSGRIVVEGLPVAEWDIDLLRDTVTMVEQQSILFSDSIGRNLHPGEAPRELLRRACADASILNDIEAMPQGFDTRIGERGVTLSGGQRQRLTIARALMREVPIHLWDNALSSVDLATEKMILQALRALDATMLVVTHRLSTVLACDRIVVLYSGGVLQQGTHRELLAHHSGWYRSFYEQQRLHEELRDLAEQAPQQGAA